MSSKRKGQILRDRCMFRPTKQHVQYRVRCLLFVSEQAPFNAMGARYQLRAYLLIYLFLLLQDRIMPSSFNVFGITFRNTTSCCNNPKAPVGIAVVLANFLSILQIVVPSFLSMSPQLDGSFILFEAALFDTSFPSSVCLSLLYLVV